MEIPELRNSRSDADKKKKENGFSISMVTKAPTTYHGKIQSKPNYGNMTLPPRLVDGSLSRPNKILILGCLIYFTYSLSISVDSQFLSLYYKSKGFDGTTLGVLYSITPLTTFLTIPLWGMVTKVRVNGNNRKNGNSKSSINKMETTRPFQILFTNIIIATIGQISLVVLDEPIYMMIAITIVGVFQSPAKPMLDGILINHMDDSSDFGKVRFFSILGSGFGTNLGGRLLTMAQKSISNDNLMMRDNDNETIGTKYLKEFVSKLSSGFNLLFCARFILTILPIICIQQLKIAATMKTKNGKISVSNDVLNGTNKSIDDQTSESNQEESTSILSVARDVAKYCLRDRNHLLFFLCIYIAGFSGGVSDAFSYVRYQESGCSTTHMGQSRLLSSCAGAVMFWFSGRITRRFGVQNVLILSMICAGARFSLLKRMDHQYYVYLVDFIRSTTYGVFWSSSTIYASQIGPSSLRGSILLLLNGIYNGIGRSTGAIIGGRFQAIFGINNLFLCCAGINYALALLMGVWYNHKRKSSSNIEYSTSTSKKAR